MTTKISNISAKILIAIGILFIIGTAGTCDYETIIGETILSDYNFFAQLIKGVLLITIGMCTLTIEHIIKERRQIKSYGRIHKI